MQVPAGNVYGIPLGISFFGTAFSEPTLIGLASGYEAATQAWEENLPTFAASLPNTNVAGTTLTRNGTPQAYPAKPASKVGGDQRRPPHL